MNTTLIIVLVIAIILIVFIVITSNNNNNNRKNTVASKKVLNDVKTSIKSEQLWIDKVNGVLVYKFNVFNNDPDKINQNKLQSIIYAQIKDSKINISSDYNVSADILLYTKDDMKNVNLFKGDRIPVFIGDYSDSGGYHYVNTDLVANKDSWVVGGGALSAIGIDVPLPAYTPYIIVDSTVELYYTPESNIHGLSTSSFNGDKELTYYQGLSAILSHEFHEVLINDDCISYVQFDHYAPFVKELKYGLFNNKDLCINGKKDPKTGKVILPSFMSVFPGGGMFFAIKEAGDVVSCGISLTLNSYMVDGWIMQNYPLPAFWEPYNTSNNLRYDKLGYVTSPLKPYGGLHAFVYFYSFDKFEFYMLEIINNGPITNDTLNRNSANNFPADHMYAKISVNFKPGMNLKDTLDGLHSQVWKS